MAKEKITHSICVGGPLTIHTDLATGRIRRVRPIVLTDDDAPGWVIKAHGKEYTPQRKTTLSLLGFTEKDRTYSYDRIKYPMIREDFVETPDGQNRNTENRGKSGYRRASWDEALGLVAREIKRIQGTYGKEAVTAITSSHHSWGLCGYKISLFKRFFSMLGYTRIMDNPDSWEGFHWGTPHTYGYYWRLGGPEPFDMLHDAMKNTETMIMWSHDPDTTRGGYSPEQEVERTLGQTCRSLGYDEIITYSFISPTYYDKIRWAKNDPRRKSMKIMNPLGEDTSIMRTTVLPSMLEILSRNYNYRNQAVRLYELGRVYFEREDGMADEPKVLSLGAYGDGMDFFTLKGAVEDLLASIRAENVTFEAVKDNPSYHPGRCARVLVNGQEVGVLGQIHPLVAQNYDVDAELYCAELSFPALYANKGADPQYVPLPKFPAVTRDIAVVCDEAVTVGQLEAAIRKGARGLLKEVKLFDIYRGTNIPEGKKSVAFNLVLRADDRSLTSEEADADVKSILETLEKETGAVLR